MISWPFDGKALPRSGAKDDSRFGSLVGTRRNVRGKSHVLMAETDRTKIVTASLSCRYILLSNGHVN